MEIKKTYQKIEKYLKNLTKEQKEEYKQKSILTVIFISYAYTCYNVILMSSGLIRWVIGIVLMIVWFKIREEVKKALKSK